MNWRKRALLSCVGILLVPTDAHAYLDPGTGSMILQALVAGFLGLAVTIRMYWQKVRSFFKSDSLDAGDSESVADE